MATSNTIPVVIPQPIAAQATSENINVIPNGATGTNRASFQEGFPAITRMPVIKNPLPTQVSGMPPKQQDFNGLFNVVSQHNFFAQNGGTYSFNQAVSDAIGGYPKNAVLWYFPENETPCLVRSLIDDNTNNFVNEPTLIDGIHWEMLVNPSSYANIALTNLSAAGQAKFDEKANTDASNFNADGKSLLSGLGMPSSRYIDLTLLASGSSYTAPANGWFSAFCATKASSSCYLLNNTNGINAAGTVIEGLTDGRCYIPVNKGDVISFFYNGMDVSKGAFLRFIYAEGEN